MAQSDCFGGGILNAKGKGEGKDKLKATDFLLLLGFSLWLLSPSEIKVLCKFTRQDEVI